MKLKLSIAAGIALLALASCQKEKVAATAPDAGKTNTKAIASKMDAYDYSQPIDKIVADAIAGSNDRIKGVFTDDTYSIELIPGTYVGEGNDGKSICFWVGFVCEIIFTLDPEESQTQTGSYEQPIGVITALENWPLARLATEVSKEKDEDGYTRIKHTFID